MTISQRRVRDQIVRYAARLWRRALVSGTSGNISVRLEDANLLVTPAAAALGDLDPGELVVVSPDGRVIGEGTPSSELPLHLATYRVRPDVSALIHTHPTYCVVWSKTGGVFARDTVGATETLGPVGWTSYEKPGSQELAAAVADAFAGGVNSVLMERHGLCAVGSSLESAFVLTDLAEEAAKIAYLCRTAGLER
ncbi:MAG: class II aldolase/adducin family protein [Vulcanimicrobiaceae bacterium]